MESPLHGDMYDGFGDKYWFERAGTEFHDRPSACFQASIASRRGGEGLILGPASISMKNWGRFLAFMSSGSIHYDGSIIIFFN